MDTSKKLKFKDPVQTFSQSRDVPRDPLPRGPEVERDWFEGCLFTCQETKPVELRLINDKYNIKHRIIMFISLFFYIFG